MSAMTDPEAREKWCPLSRGFDSADSGGATATNRPISYDGSRRASLNCIGPKCMAWRWTDSYDAEGDQYGFCGEFGPARHDQWGDVLPKPDASA